MGLFKRKNAKSKRAERLKRQIKATTQNTIKFDKLDESGHMHISNGRYSQTFQIGDVSYTTAKYDDKIEIIDTYADALNLLESNSNYQLLVLNRRITEDVVSNVQYDLKNDEYDVYREEYNDIIMRRFENNAKSFEVSKYMTITLEGLDNSHAKRQFHDVGTQLIEQFKKADITIRHLNGTERLGIFADLLRDMKEFPYSFEDINESGIGEKSFIAPNRIQISEKHLEIDDKFAKVKYIRHFPKSMSDKLIYEMTQLGIEFALTVQVSVYDDFEIMEEIDTAETNADINLIRSQKRASQSNVYLSEEYIGAGKDKATSNATKKWRSEIQDDDQKIFKGMIAVFFKADTLEQLKEYEAMIARAGNKIGVKFEDIFYYQEDALNSILPIGENFVDVRQKLTRRMTTTNVATQIPFTHTNLLSHSPKALYYGQNQLSNHMITLDRKEDLLTGSGVIVGTSGSGKSFSVKLNEIIPTILRYPEDRVIIVDPEDEYSDIGYPFNAQIIDISVGSNTSINLLDLPDIENLSGEEARDPIGDKANFLITIFESILGDFTDSEVTIVDRVTRQTYQNFENPTLREWHEVLLSQPEAFALELALKLEIYTIGSHSIFSRLTNVDLTNQLVIFNLKHLSGKLKPFALLVIQDFIWNQVVSNKGKFTTRLYFDELQLYLRTPLQAVFFTELYSRVRKYGAIPTGITQNIETIAAIEEGRKLLSNSEFMMILKQKDTDIAVLKEVITLTDDQIKYIKNPKAKGTGLIYAGGTIVPFENPIPKETHLYKMIETDA